MKELAQGSMKNIFPPAALWYNGRKPWKRSVEKLVDETAETAKTGLNEGGFCHAVKKTRAGRPFGHSGED
ncbi:hypothetical protein [Paenibacillus tyrfis]|uniref:hypothetical protein n=1 Tax=Paenibacillus tyrfis TaxID=1501230 RepID=UPI000B58B673|nr:hypothetical protein [Paenibacillus tyrfis]